MDGELYDVALGVLARWHGATAGEWLDGLLGACARMKGTYPPGGPLGALAWAHACLPHVIHEDGRSILRPRVFLWRIDLRRPLECIGEDYEPRVAALFLAAIEPPSPAAPPGG